MQPSYSVSFAIRSLGQIGKSKAAHMLKAHDYPVPAKFLQVPLDASMDMDSFQRDNSTASFVDNVAPVSTPSQMDLASLFPME